MGRPICQKCLIDGLIRVAETIDMPDRGVLVKAAVDIEKHMGCIHLAEDGEGIAAGLWAWTACGKRGSYYSTCTNPDHVTCSLCRLRRKLDEK